MPSIPAFYPFSSCHRLPGRLSNVLFINVTTDRIDGSKRTTVPSGGATIEGLRTALHSPPSCTLSSTAVDFVVLFLQIPRSQLAWEIPPVVVVFSSHQHFSKGSLVEGPSESSHSDADPAPVVKYHYFLH